jgi:DNA-binding MarR family transcriptional regulator
MYLRVPREPNLLDQQVCFALHATSRAVTQAYAPLLAPLGVTYPQYLVLLVLWEDDSLTVSGIGERLHLDSGTLTPLLGRLEGLGLVTRARDLDDQRVVRVSLTPAGKKLRVKARGITARMACAMGLSPAELTSLRTSLQRMLRHLQSHEGT